MGIWTWLERHDLPADPSTWAARTPALLEDRYQHDGSRAVEEIHTHRGWHALHVALTGCELGGAAPGADVLGVARGTFSDWDDVRLPDQVRVLAAFLDAQRPETLIATLRAATAGDVVVYDDDRWDDAAVIELFGRVRAFYRAAADAGQAVVLHRR